MKRKKFLSVVLAIAVMMFSSAPIYALEIQTNEEIQETFSPRFTNMGAVYASLSISNTTASCECGLTLYRTSKIKIEFSLQKSATGNGAWKDYRDLGFVEKTVTGEVEEYKNTSALSTGYYRLKIKVTATANGYSEETTIYSNVERVW